MEPINGNPRADGISLACLNSLVERNVSVDVSKGGPGLTPRSSLTRRTAVSSSLALRERKCGTTMSTPARGCCLEVCSRLEAAESRLISGINLVDYEPWKGDYFGTNVHHNTIHALAGFLRVGIVVGLSSWSDDTDAIVHSGTVTDNVFEGPRFGYGLVVSSADRFTVLRNTVSPNADFSGVPGPHCPTAPANGPPAPFLIHRGSATGTYQDDFVNGEVQHSEWQRGRSLLVQTHILVICIDPPDVEGVPYKPWRLRDSPQAIQRATEESGGAVSFVSGVWVQRHQWELTSGLTSRRSGRQLSDEAPQRADRRSKENRATNA